MKLKLALVIYTHKLYSYNWSLCLILGDMNKVKNSQDSRVVEIQKEKDQALEDLASVEGAFSDLHRRYEKLKQVVESYKKVRGSLVYNLVWT